MEFVAKSSGQGIYVEKRNMCHGTQGDTRISSDTKQALSKSSADVIVMAVGIPNNTKPDVVREATARTLMDFIQPGSEFSHVKLVVVVSSTDARGSGSCQPYAPSCHERP